MTKRVDYTYHFVLDRECHEPITDSDWENLQEQVGELVNDGYGSNEELTTFIYDWIGENKDKWKEEKEEE